MQPDPEQQFVVEVNASDTGVGVVLSQRLATDKKNHDSVLLSKKFLAAECDYSL